jgi:glycosyltransferase involved in cell wall biosynthesis
VERRAGRAGIADEYPNGADGGRDAGLLVQSARLPMRAVALIVTPRYLPLLGGTQRECALLAGEFARRGFKPVVVTELLGQDLPRSEFAGEVEIHRVPSSSTRSLLVQLRVAVRIGRLVLRYRRDAAFIVVRSVSLPAVVIGLLKAVRLISCPTFVTVENGGSEDEVVVLSRRPAFRLFRALIAANDRLNGLCEANVTHLREAGFPEHKIARIPNGVDATAWKSTRAPERVETFLFLGRIEREKGVFELAQAFATLHSRRPRVRLVVAGDGDDGAAFVARCGELGIAGAVELLGQVEYERLDALFAAVDCLVLPSYSEAMPLSVLEAAVRHRVLVASDVGDLRSLFGDRIHLCRARDPESLAEAMEAATAAKPVTDYGDVVARVAIETVAAELFALLGVH